MEPAPDATQVAEIESPFPPRQALAEADDEAAGPPPAMDDVIAAADGGAPDEAIWSEQEAAPLPQLAAAPTPLPAPAAEPALVPDPVPDTEPAPRRFVESDFPAPARAHPMDETPPDWSVWSITGIDEDGAVAAADDDAADHSATPDREAAPLPQTAAVPSPDTDPVADPAPVADSAPVAEPSPASVPASPAPVSTLSSAPEPAPIPVTDSFPVSDPAPAPIPAADPTLVSNPARTTEPAPDATPVAGIETIVAPDQALELETASADLGGSALATMDEWVVALATIVEGVDSPPPQSERTWTPESAAQASPPMPVPVADPAPETESVSASEPGNADAPLTANGAGCVADAAAAGRQWYLPAATPVVSMCYDQVALLPQVGQPAPDSTSQPPARRDPAPFTVDAPRARVPEEPTTSAPSFVNVDFLLFGA
jgi:hypothetical protein